VAQGDPVGHAMTQHGAQRGPAVGMLTRGFQFSYSLFFYLKKKRYFRLFKKTVMI
jgi:hypothetical protein